LFVCFDFLTVAAKKHIGPLRLCPRTYRYGILSLEMGGRIVRIFRAVLDWSAIDAVPGSSAGSTRFPLRHAAILF
jgi:hypothetical protein